MLVEWRATGRFDNPGFVNDDLIVEASKDPVHAAGVALMTLRPDRDVRMGCCFDALAILEQVLRPPS